MKGLKRFFFQPRIGIQKSAYLWNMIAGISSALESVLFSIIITRVIGLAEAGIATLGFAVGNLMATIGRYGVRTFQVTDVECRYSFPAYFRTRLVTTGAMILANIGYILYCCRFKGYSEFKATVVLLICMKFIIEVVEDVFAGECQKRGRLDVGSKVFVARSFCFVATSLGLMIATKNMVLSLGAALGCITAVEIISLRTVNGEMTFSFAKPEKGQIRELLIRCAPLFLSTFSFFYITNAPKYAIDTVMTDEVQACYGFIAFSVFAIELLNNFIYQPTLVNLATEWTEKQLEKMRKRMNRQILIIIGLTCIALTGAYFLGIPVLSAVFGTDLTGYKREMLILLMTGGLLAMIGYFTTVLVTMRETRIMIIAYLTDLVLSFFLYTPVIRTWGVMGGVILYGGLCAMFALYEYLAIRIKMSKAERMQSA